MSQTQSLPPHADGYDAVQQRYDTLLRQIEGRAKQYDDFMSGARAEADEFVREYCGDDRVKLAFVLDRSYNGPHYTYTDHSFDTNEGMAALKALAASSLVSDIIADG